METARLLVEKGADVNVLNEGGCYGSSLHYAVFKNDVEFVKYLIGKGADVNCISGQGYSCLHQAALSDVPEIIKILISHGANVNEVDEELLTPLHVAARDGYGECVMLLVKAGADVFARNSEKKTAKDLADMATEQKLLLSLQAARQASFQTHHQRKRRELQLNTRRLLSPQVGDPANRTVKNFKMLSFQTYESSK